MNTLASLKTLATSALIASTFSLIACGGSVDNKTASDNEASAGNINPVDARQATMHDLNDAMGVMGNMIKNPDKFDANTFKKEAAFLAETSEKSWEHFDDQSAGAGGSTEAVWNDKEGFATQIEMFKAVSAGLNDIAQNAKSVDEVKTAFAGVGAGCQSCHTIYKAE
ncbi:cytochrome c [Psychrobacter sp. HD31]|uniref:c-type cytochrome n=1 Tax=Psychrobacter sp. HD31 TaxID=3112003 RepID=UPI003DA26397